MAHLDSTPMRINAGSFVKEAPERRADLIKHMQACNTAGKNANKAMFNAEPGHDQPHHDNLNLRASEILKG